MKDQDVEFPAEGGSFIRQPDGSLQKQVEPAQEPDAEPVKTAETPKKKGK